MFICYSICWPGASRLVCGIVAQRRIAGNVYLDKGRGRANMGERRSERDEHNKQSVEKRLVKVVITSTGLLLADCG